MCSLHANVLCGLPGSIVSVLLLVFILPESPRFLVYKERMQQAAVSVAFFHPRNVDVKPVGYISFLFHSRIVQILAEHEREIEAEKESSEGKISDLWKVCFFRATLTASDYHSCRCATFVAR